MLFNEMTDSYGLRLLCLFGWVVAPLYHSIKAPKSSIKSTNSRSSKSRQIHDSSCSAVLAPSQDGPAIMALSVRRKSQMPPRGYCLPAISSHSLGRVFAGHDLRTKLHAAASHNIRGIELVYEDLYAHACLLSGGPTPSNLIAAAREIRNWTESLSLTIIVLQAFSQYEGLISRTAHAAAIEKAKLWFHLAKELGTCLILIPSNFLPAKECTSDFATIVRDMTKLADLGAQQNPPICFAYESLCWGTHIDTCEEAHAVVLAVDRWNFGYCLDTFNIAGRVYGDPAAADGKTENAEVDMVESMSRMVECVRKEKIFFIQVVDAERVSPPLTKDHPWYDVSQPTRMSWSRNARLFAFEEERGGYLPVLDVCRAVFQGLEYRGWVSFELFSRTLTETGVDVPAEHAARAARSFEKVVDAFPEIVGKGPQDVSTTLETLSTIRAHEEGVFAI